ncbi:MAG: hypothetical protein WCH34_14610, partial [Bacteroidota bacterium]
AGEYSIIVTDANGCSATTSTTISEPAPIIPTITSTNISCNGGNDGTIHGVIVGGTAPYSSQFQKNGGCIPPCVWPFECLGGFCITPTYPGPNPDMTGIKAGEYSIIVTDANGCSATTSTTITEPPVLKIVVDSVRNVSCSGVHDGNIYISYSGGTPPYSWKTYALNILCIPSCPAGWICGPPCVLPTFPTFPDGLSAGTYLIVITDAKGCSDTVSQTITENPLIPVNGTISVSANPVCIGTAVTFTATIINGGLSPNYQWMVNGSTVGSNSAEYSYIPSNNDVVSCIMTSSELCVEGNPAISSMTMTVNSTPAPVGNNIQSFSNATTINSLVISGTDIIWYDASTGGNVISTTEILTNGTTYYASQTIGGCESKDRFGVTVNLSLYKTVNLHLILEGLYDPSNTNKMVEALDIDWNSGMTFAKYGQGIADRIQVELYEETPPYDSPIVNVSGIDLATNGLATFQISPSYNGSYFIRVLSRNHLEVWSAMPVSFNLTTVDYDFTTNALNAYQAPGANDPQVQVASGEYAFYLGDLDQSLGVDFDDFNVFEPYLNEGTYGFNIADFNGNGLVDFDDFNLFEPRLNLGPFAQYPGMP